MLAHIFRENLRKFYFRAYGDQRPLRIVSIAAIAAITAGLHVWSVAAAAIWTVVYAAAEFAMVYWWRRIQPRLEAPDQAEMARLKAELIAICAVACAIGAVPALFTPFAGVTAAILGALLCIGILLVAAVEHSLSRSMFLFTTPVAVLGLLWNLWAVVGSGPGAWVLLILGTVLVVNAWSLHSSNAKVFEELLTLRMEAEAANTAKSEFLAVMSHEIRTPLNGVLGMAQILGRSELRPEQRQQLSVITASGQSLLTVLNGILDLSKIESGKVVLDLHPFDLDEVLQDTAAAYGPLAAQKGLRFTVEIDPELKGIWRGDSAKLAQVLGNLLSNALKFTHSGSITLSATLSSSGAVSFRVSDTGIGVDQAKAELIFDKFTQADASTSRRFGGTGLGLAICHGLVACMGGELTLTSRPGAGSSFAFSLHLHLVSRAASPDALPRPAGPAPEPEPAQETTDRPLRILAAEDNPTNRLILSALLGPLGCDLTLVEDGQDAVDAFARSDFDLILMDVQMPRMDGIEAARAIRRTEIDSGRQHTPVIALTANVMRHQTDAYRAAGMDEVVAKPVELTALVGAIERVLAAPEPVAREA